MFLREKFIKSILSFIILILSSSCNSLFYYPEKNYIITPNQFSINYQEKTIVLKDATKLNSWLLNTTKDKLGLVLFLHGNAQNISYHFPAYSWLTEVGFDVLAVDYRGYGKSEGIVDYYKMHNDLKEVIDFSYHLAQKKNLSLVIFGQSLGGSAIVSALAKSPLRIKVKALFLDSAFSSYKKITRDKVKTFYLTWPFSYPLSLFVSDKFSPDRFIGSVSTPIFIASFKDDFVVPSYHSKRLYNFSKSPKKLWIRTGNSHTGVFLDKVGREKFMKFLSDN